MVGSGKIGENLFSGALMAMSNVTTYNSSNELELMWRQFDIKILLTCSKYEDRRKSIFSELSRVGIRCDQINIDVPSPLKKIIQQNIMCDENTSDMGKFSCVLAHYNAIKQAVELGKSSCLIMEDDIRFLTDLSLIQKILAEMPKDYDYVQFEYLKPTTMTIQDFNKMKSERNTGDCIYWHRFQKLNGGGAYALSRTGMEFMVSQIEESFIHRKPLKMNDFYNCRGKDLTKYFCYPPIAVQQIFSMSNHNDKAQWKINEQIGIQKSAYTV